MTNFNDKPIAEMSDAEYNQWLGEAAIAELKYQTALDEMFDCWFAGHRTLNQENLELLKQAGKGVNQ